MANKYAFDTVDRLFKDLCQNTKPFGGKVIIVSEDFRQTLTIVRHGSRAQVVESSVISCKIWLHFHYSKLHKNMRISNDDMLFKKWLLNVGEEQYSTKFERNNSLLKLSPNFLSNGDFISIIFGNNIHPFNISIKNIVNYTPRE